MSTSIRARRGRRDNCPAELHDTLYAYQEHRCRCLAALRAKAAKQAREWSRHPKSAGRAWQHHRDVDEVVILRAKYGEPLRLGVTERYQAIRELTDARRSVRQICELLGVGHATVTRARRRTRPAVAA